ncbi:MAG: hypothetical protein LBQ76_10070 [Candidatus Fibromonas sp.]|jgi:hypothetical protein|nr:hypothetical protein [Candidatus Fibromonas sp.]
MITLKTGMVLHMDVPDMGIDHLKYFVVLNHDKIDPNIIGVCLINSKLSEITSKKKFQIEILQKDYAFLDHASYIDCGVVKKIKKDAMDDEHDKGKIRVVCYLNEKDMSKVMNAGTSNIALSKRDKSFFTGV